MILDEIKDGLQTIDPNVFYGAVDNTMNETMWDYIVFNRTRRKDSANRTGCSHYFSVHIIRENYVPEELEESVIAKMLEIAGMKRTDEDAVYTYVVKPNTNVVVEMLSINFVRPKKGV